jgi:hypothetical protein
MITLIAGKKIKRSAAIIALGLALSIPASAELSVTLTQDLAKVSVASAEQQQALANAVDLGLRSGLNEPDLSRLLNQGAAKNYGGGDLALYIERLASLQRDGLPVVLVRDKMLEGMAKNTPATTILQVATNWSAALADANSSLRGLEQRGLNYTTPSERAALINAGATLQQRHGVKQPLLALAGSSLESGRFRQSAASLHAAAGLAELLLLRGAKAEQALALPTASLRANHSAQRIQELQQEVVKQLRQGAAVTDIAAGFPNAPLGKGPMTPGIFSGNPPGTGGFPGGAGAPGFAGSPGGPGHPGASANPAAPAPPVGAPGFSGGPGGFRR